MTAAAAAVAILLVMIYVPGMFQASTRRYYLAGQVLYEVCARQTQITSQPGTAFAVAVVAGTVCYWLGVSFSC